MRFHEKKQHILQLLLYFSIFQHATSKVIFTVEDGGNVTTRHLHKLRHSRDSTTHYASSSIINLNRQPNPARLELFSLNCPHVVDARNKDNSIEVLWTLNETVWLKIIDGQQTFVNGESTFNKRRVAGKTVMRLLLNNARYLFDYDELTGDFFMEINPVLWSTDVGAWQCHVTVRQADGKSHTLTSRRRIKPELNLIEDHPKTTTLPSEDQFIEHVDLKIEDEGEEVISESEISRPVHVQKRGSSQQQSFASFSRQNDDNVYMTRKSEEIATNVVFARNDGPLIRQLKPVRHRELERLFDAHVDYELDMTDDMSFAYPPYLNAHSRAHRAQYYHHNGGSAHFSFAYLIVCLVLLFCT